MDFNWNSILNNPLVSSVVSKATDSALGIKSSKAAASVPTPQISVQAPSIDQGMSQSTMIMIGVAVLAVVGGLFFFLKKK